MAKQKEETLPKTIFAVREQDGDDSFLIASEDRGSLAYSEPNVVGRYELVMSEPRLTRNAAECVGCGKVLESTHVHDYRTHECKKKPGIRFMVGGGLCYTRRGWGGEGKSSNPNDHFIERSEYAPV